MDRIGAYYNQDIIEKFNLFRRSYINLSSKHPTLKISFYYATKGDKNTINPKISNKVEIFERDIKTYFGNAKIEIKFFGARELIELSRLEKNYTLTLDSKESVLSSSGENYVVLSTLSDFYKFIVDDDKNLRRYLFESNVRDFQGDVKVNEEILETLSKKSELDFWWLNNGITILATKATLSGKKITLDNVHIVNGLQTSYCIYNFFNSNLTQDDRLILIKILVIQEGVNKDKIIRATNSQTAINPASLRATDEVQRDIEQFFIKMVGFMIVEKIIIKI